jgi:hypothetical protein
MLEILKKFNYFPPNIVEYDNNGVNVRKMNGSFCLSLNNTIWMNYDTIAHIQAYQLYSHYTLAKGHCICTGLGFGIRENWILTKPEVSKVTVIENNKDLIEYHQYIKSPFLDHIEIINCNASEYVGKCDTLLLDHYEYETEEVVVKDVFNIQNNIECNTLWFWPLEKYILKHDIRDKKIEYDFFKYKNHLWKLPNLDTETILAFCFMWFSQSTHMVDKS